MIKNFKKEKMNQLMNKQIMKKSKKENIINYVKSAYWTLYMTRNIGGPSIYFGF